MKLKLWRVSPVKEPALRSLAAEYRRRLTGVFLFEEKTIKQSTLPTKEARLAEEGERLLKNTANSRLIVLDEKGKSFSSGALAKWLNKELARQQSLALVIGGPDGVADSVKQKAVLLLKLSDLTLPHDLAYLLLVEQLYRVQTISKGQPYHR